MNQEFHNFANRVKRHKEFLEGFHVYPEIFRDKIRNVRKLGFTSRTSPQKISKNANVKFCSIMESA